MTNPELFLEALLAADDASQLLLETVTRIKKQSIQLGLVN
jgi:hypothetical protein